MAKNSVYFKPMTLIRYTVHIFKLFLFFIIIPRLCTYLPTKINNEEKMPSQISNLYSNIMEFKLFQTFSKVCGCLELFFLLHIIYLSKSKAFIQFFLIMNFGT
uniref:Uncharacterized protein n=1 Tax=Cacopsylla melanoneura TaxID=428564 RepID=A0A8D9BTL9_9HEMI